MTIIALEIEINFRSPKEHWKKFESNNNSIALNILFVPYNTKQIVRAYPPKRHNNKRENQVILLMITGGKKWHYLAVKSLSLIRGIISNHDGGFYCLIVFTRIVQKINLKDMKKYIMIMIIVM